MEILTEFDELQAALAKVNMNESVLPYVNGRLVSNDKAYNMTQKILNCPEMISAHKYLYELDMDQLTEEDEDKISKLYDLGVKRGFIVDDLTDWDDEDGEAEEVEDDIELAAPVQKKPQNTLFKAKIPCWTVIYSATKDGDIKTGEAYSNAVSMTAAKADVNAKLSQCGYDNITILAIENCSNTPQPPGVKLEVNEAGDEQENAEEDKDSKDDESTSDSDSSDDEDASSEDDTSADEEKDDTSADEEKDDNEESASSDEDAKTEDAKTEDAKDEQTDDSGSEDDENDSGENEDDSSSDEDEEAKSDDEEEEEELDANEKAELRDLYRKTFRNVLVKCKFDTSFNDLTLDQKVKFFTELSKAWKEENDPQEFMDDKELEQLDNIVAYKSDDEDNEDEEQSDEKKSDDKDSSDEDDK